MASFKLFSPCRSLCIAVVASFQLLFGSLYASSVLAEDMLSAPRMSVDITYSGDEEKPASNQNAEQQQGVVTREEGNKELVKEDAQFEEDEDYLNEAEGQAVSEIVPDHIEGYNRAMGQFNAALYDGLLSPVAEGYATVFPHDFRVGVSNFFDNLSMPVHFFSALLQGDDLKAGHVLERFVLNTTLGMLGMADTAADNFDLPKVEDKMEDALIANGTERGDYIVLPLFGPSTTRGLVAKVLDGFLNPVWLFAPDVWTSVAASGEDNLNTLSFNPSIRKDITEGAIDPYIAIQDAYIQYLLAKEKEKKK